MSETQVEPTTEPTAQAAQPDGDQQPAKETDWVAEARKWEKLAKSNKAAADKLAELEEAQKTEAQKTAERIAALETENKGYRDREQIAKWKDEVAEATGVPFAALAGSTKEEIEAHAEVLKPLITAPQQQQPKAQPVPAMGSVPELRNVPLKDRIAAAEQAGDKALVASLKAMMLATAS